MASPSERKGHDLHDKCARCRDKSIGEDDCVMKKQCSICEGFSDSQREMLSTPTLESAKTRRLDF